MRDAKAATTLQRRQAGRYTAGFPSRRRIGETYARVSPTAAPPSDVLRAMVAMELRQEGWELDAIAEHVKHAPGLKVDPS